MQDLAEDVQRGDADGHQNDDEAQEAGLALGEGAGCLVVFDGQIIINNLFYCFEHDRPPLGSL